MDLKIEIPKIHCARTTLELGKDEIYYGVLVMAGRIVEGQFVLTGEEPVFAKVSEVKKKVKKGTAWRPTINNHIVTVDDTTQALAVSLVLYEEDNGDSRDALQESFTEIAKPEKFDWAVLIKDAKEIVLPDVNENERTDFEDILSAVTQLPTLTFSIVGGFLFKIGKHVFKHLRQDDLLGEASDAFDLSKEDFNLPREYSFRRHKGKYKVTLQVTKV